MSHPVTSAAAADAVSFADRHEVLIAGVWETANGPLAQVVDPTTERVVATVREASTSDVSAAIASASSAFASGPWPRMSPAERADVLDRIADGVEARSDDLVRIGVAESGIPVRFGSVPFRAFVTQFRRAAELGRRHRFSYSSTRADGGVSHVFREPSGVVAAIVPWNGALGASGLKLGPALVAGCTAILKTPPETPLATYVLADVIAELTEAGTIPPGVLSIFAGGADVGSAMVADARVNKVSFTGSTAVGKKIMSSAADNITRVTLELGGKSAAIVLDDAPLDDVLRSLPLAGCGSAGQVCTALTRVLVSRRRQKEFEEAFAAACDALVVGDPRDEATQIGPLTIARQQERVDGHVRGAVRDGARVVTGGARPAGLDRGFFYAPTVLSDVAPDSRIAQEEVFGPVISVIAYDDVDDAVRIANDSSFGLSGSVYAADTAVALSIARRVRSGTVTVNGKIFDASVPFGGFKQSGIGREGGEEGLEEFLETQAIHLPA